MSSGCNDCAIHYAGCLVVVMIMYGGCGRCTCNSYATHYADCQVVVAVVLYIKLASCIVVVRVIMVVPYIMLVVWQL